MLAVLGVLIIVAALVAAEVVRSSDRATLALGERLDVPVVVTEPGVLDAVGSEVTVRATAEDDEPVVLAVGRTAEVEAWLGENDHARVTGLSSWEELTVEVVTGGGQDATEAPTDAATDSETEAPADGAATEAALPNPAGSDLWVVETTSTGSAELTWTDSPGRWSLVAATDGAGPAPDLELEWGRQVATPWLVPAIVVGGIALIAGLTMLVLNVLARREERRREDARARRDAGGGAAPLSITDTDPGTGERLTRRQIREMERDMARAEQNLHTDHEAGLPPVPLAADEDADDDARPAGDSGASATGPGTDDVDARRDPEEASTVERDPAAEDHPETWETDAEHQPAGSTVEREPVADISVVDPSEEEPDPVPEESAVEPAPAPGEPEGEHPPADDDEEGRAPTATSWRSVWGFGGAAVGRGAPPGPAADTTDQTNQTDDREER